MTSFWLCRLLWYYKKFFLSTYNTTFAILLYKNKVIAAIQLLIKTNLPENPIKFAP